MATGSMKRVDNIYFRCRKEAAKTNPALSSREATAELLNISVSSLANYELGITKCIPVDVIVRMSDLYKAPEIMNAYCANDCLIGKGQPIAVEITSIEKVVLRLLKTTEGGNMEKFRSALIEAGLSGLDCEGERVIFEALRDRVDEIMIVLSELRMLCEKALKG